jgi:hypothetical protein
MSLTPITGDPFIIGTATGAIIGNEKARNTVSGLFVWPEKTGRERRRFQRGQGARKLASELERQAPRSAAGVLQRGYKVFFALALESILGGSEVCDARRDFFPLAREPVLLVGHTIPLIRVSRSMVIRIGARMRRLRRRIVVAHLQRDALA